MAKLKIDAAGMTLGIQMKVQLSYKSKCKAVTAWGNVVIIITKLY